MFESVFVHMYPLVCMCKELLSTSLFPLSSRVSFSLCSLSSLFSVISGSHSSLALPLWLSFLFLLSLIHLCSSLLFCFLSIIFPFITTFLSLLSLYFFLSNPRHSLSLALPVPQSPLSPPYPFALITSLHSPLHPPLVSLPPSMPQSQVPQHTVNRTHSLFH